MRKRVLHQRPMWMHFFEWARWRLMSIDWGTIHLRRRVPLLTEKQTDGSQSLNISITRAFFLAGGLFLLVWTLILNISRLSIGKFILVARTTGTCEIRSSTCIPTQRPFFSSFACSASTVFRIGWRLPKYSFARGMLPWIAGCTRHIRRKFQEVEIFRCNKSMPEIDF